MCPDAIPVKEIFPPPVAVVMEEAPPIMLIPCDAELLGPPVPFKMMLPPPVVLKFAPVFKEMP